MNKPTALRVQSISKRFGKTLANDDVSLTLDYGKIHALLGENGAGKSTLVSILYGLQKPDNGYIEQDGEPRVFHKPSDALRAGIGLVQQHFSLIPAFSVLDNIILGHEGCNRLLLDRKSNQSNVQDTLERFEIDLPLNRHVGDLTVGQQQQVEIVRILSRSVRIVLFDEPTAALAGDEIERFLSTIKSLRKQGIAVMLITHRMPEVMQTADEVTVLRHGKVVLHDDMHRLDEDIISSAIVGESLPSEEAIETQIGAEILSLQKVTPYAESKNQCHLSTISININEGEILGIAGIAGNGQEELIDVMMGLKKIKTGSIILKGDDISTLKTKKRRQRGMALIPQDRSGCAMFPELPLFDNYLLHCFSSAHGGGWVISHKQHRKTFLSCLTRYGIVYQSLSHPISELSGGHQQRVIISRELLSNPTVIIAHNPTRGLDLRAARFVHESLQKAAAEGASIGLFSSELPELFLLCHRVAVIYRGQIIAERKKDDWNAETLGKYMSGAQLS